MSRTTVSIKLSPELKARLQLVAQRDGTNLNRLVVRLIEAYLETELPEENSLATRVSALEVQITQFADRLSELESK